jgi:hypothetical protein
MDRENTSSHRFELTWGFGHRIGYHRVAWKKLILWFPLHAGWADSWFRLCRSYGKFYLGTGVDTFPDHSRSCIGIGFSYLLSNHFQGIAKII